jgi:hypothetical protein
MEIEFFNVFYFLGIGVPLIALLLLHFCLRKAPKFLKIVLVFALTLVPIAAWALRPFYAPTGEPWYMMLIPNDFLTFNMIFLPLSYFGRTRFFRSGVVLLGMIVGLMGLAMPVGVIGEFTLGTAVYYVQYGLLFAVPILMLSLGLHKIKLIDVITMPAYTLMLMTFALSVDVITVNAAVYEEYANAAWQWAPTFSIDISWLIPEALQSIPVVWAIVPCFAVLVPVCLIIDAVYLLHQRRARSSS